MSEDRNFFRKRISSPGYVLEPTGKVHFQVRDLSLDGLQGQFESKPDFEVGDLVQIDLPDLEIERKATVMWIRPDPNPDDGFHVGFFFGKPA